MTDPAHRTLREMLGAYALGHLGPEERQTVRAHLDGCADCRAELAELEPLAGLLDAVDPERFETPPHPPADLGGRIRDAVAAEGRTGRRGPGPARRVPVARVALAAAVVVLVALAGGVVGRTTAPEPPPVPLEAVTLDGSPSSSIAVESADVVPHTWGVELRIVGDGFAEGETFRAAFRERATGRLTPAGRFIGTGAQPMTCNLQSATLRDDVTEVVVLDAAGTVVLSADL